MKSKEWDGGVPPVGTVCEYFLAKSDEWRKCEVVAYYFAGVVAADELHSSAVLLPSTLFRPIKTPEQTAEEERLQAIHEMIELVARYSTFNDVMGVLYDAGYRKTEVNK